MRSLLVLVLLAATAHARPAPRPMLPAVDCYLEPTVHPAPKSKDVPLDTKAWIVGGELRQFDVEYRLRWDKSERIAKVTKHAPFEILELDLGKLLPNKRYTLLEGNHVISTFTTGRALDARAPRAPVVARAMAMNDLLETSYFEIDFGADADRHVIELLIGDRVVLAPGGEALRLGMSCANVNVAGKFCFVARAIDVAGNRSDPTEYCGTLAQGPGLEPSSDNRYPPGRGYDPMPDMTPTGERYPWRPALGATLALAIGAIVIARARRRRSARHLA